MSGQRIEPTPEDMAIFQRNLHRFMRDHTAAARAQRAISLETEIPNIVPAVRRFMGDYMHFGPSGVLRMESGL